MLMLLNAGFGEPLPTADLVLIRSLGYQGVRQDVPTAAVAPALVDNLMAANLYGIFVIPVAHEAACQDIAHAVAAQIVLRAGSGMGFLEVGNEEDLSGKRWARDPVGWARLVADVATIAAAHSNIAPGGPVQVVSGGVSSVSRQAMGWLERSRVRELPVGVGYHQYRSTPPAEPLDGYRTRGEEFRTLRDAAGDRETWMTESGWHTAKRTSGHWPSKRTWSYTDAEVAQFLSEEMARNDEVGARCFVTYQLNDGADPANDQDRFGIRRADGTLKPSSRVLLT
jgi:hypothetical protein